MQNEKQARLFCDKVDLASLGVIAAIGCVDLIRYIVLGALIQFVTVLVIETLFILIA